MFTLIKREIEDHIAFFIGAAACSLVFIALSIAIAYNDKSDGPPVVWLSLSIPVAMIVIIGFGAMGTSQMYNDRTKRISALLSTLPVSRSRILIARIAAGILAMLILLVPLAVTIRILLRLFAPYPVPYPVYEGIVTEVFTSAFLMGFACYCIGLQTGFTSSKIAPTFGAIVLTCVLVPLIIIKGLGTHFVLLTLAFIAASLIRTWNKFMTTAL